MKLISRRKGGRCWRRREKVVWFAIIKPSYIVQTPSAAFFPLFRLAGFLQCRDATYCLFEARRSAMNIRYCRAGALVWSRRRSCVLEEHGTGKDFTWLVFSFRILFKDWYGPAIPTLDLESEGGETHSSRSDALERWVTTVGSTAQVSWSNAWLCWACSISLTRSLACHRWNVEIFERIGLKPIHN
jgi:hypothetical protein